MKTLLTLFFAFSLSAYAGAGLEAWRKAHEGQRIKIFEAYRDWYGEASQLEKTREWETKKVVFFSFLSEAWANVEGLDCIFAGWPSKRIGSCSSPARSNPDYSNGPCSSSQMQCQPLLFGEGLCVSVATQAQRSSAFSHCEQEYVKDNRTPASVLAEVHAKSKDALLSELIDFADRVCSQGAQAQTGMCRRLVKKIDEILEVQESRVVSEIEAAFHLAMDASERARLSVLPQRSNCVESSPEANPVAPDRALLATLETMLPVALPARALAGEGADSPDSLEEGEVSPFVRENERDGICGGSRPADPSYDVTFSTPCSASEDRVVTGVSFKTKPNSRYALASGPGMSPNPYRLYNLVAKDGAKDASMIYVQEEVLSNDSANVKSIIVLLPRRGIPQAEIRGDTVHVTLGTGETVEVDRATGDLLPGGALSEGPMDTNLDRFTRRPPNLKYTGSGISIRVDHRYEYPSDAGGDPTAEVTQKGRTCSVARGKIWDAEGGILLTDDAELVKVLNASCPPKPGQSAFRLP